MEMSFFQCKFNIFIDMSLTHRENNITELLEPIFPAPLLQNNISPLVEVKNLGIIFDSDKSFDNYIAKVCQACYYHLRDL